MQFHKRQESRLPEIFDFYMGRNDVVSTQFWKLFFWVLRLGLFLFVFIVAHAALYLEVTSRTHFMDAA